LAAPLHAVRAAKSAPTGRKSKAFRKIDQEDEAILMKSGND
jgi:hypothetical protein